MLRYNIVKAWDEVTPYEFEAQININFSCVTVFNSGVLPNMQKNGWGRIVTVGSVQQLRPHPQMIVYAASKMAQLSMVKSLAPQFGKAWSNNK
jgi:glucose 1-dehydrogenase